MKIALLSMPFAPHDRSSVTCAQLKASLEKNLIKCEVRYLHKSLINKIGLLAYRNIQNIEPLAEWIFACQSFDVNDEEFLESVDIQSYDYQRDNLLYIRDLAKEFIDEIINSGQMEPFQAIGFTASFGGQLMASFALSKRIKELYPSKHIIIGGSCVFGKAGYECMKVPWVDFVCQGEGDQCFAELCQSLEYSTNPVIPGFYYRDNNEIQDAGLCNAVNLNDLPIPDYDNVNFIPTINSIESARGCWYGTKTRCTFCQLAYDNYRTKNPDKLYKEINVISEQNGVYNFDFTDELVPPNIFSQVLSRFAGRNFKFSMMIKPTLPLKNFKIAKESGVYEWFSGMENMHSEILKLFRKGHSPLHNVSVLKWSKYYGIRISWNFIYSVPGEKEEWYRENLKLLKKITHFDPPLLNKLEILRDTPYVNEKLVSGVRPHQWCRAVYPDYMNLENIVRLLDYDSYKHVLPLHKISYVLNFLLRWRIDSLSNGLKTVKMEKDYILDTRYGNKEIPITPTQKSILQYCDITRKDIQHNSDVDYLINKNLLIHLDGQYLSLVEPLDDSAIFEKQKLCDAHQLSEKEMIPLPILQVAENTCSVP